MRQVRVSCTGAAKEGGGSIPGLVHLICSHPTEYSRFFTLASGYNDWYVCGCRLCTGSVTFAVDRIDGLLGLPDDSRWPCHEALEYGLKLDWQVQMTAYTRPE